MELKEFGHAWEEAQSLAKDKTGWKRDTIAAPLEAQGTEKVLSTRD